MNRGLIRSKVMTRSDFDVSDLGCELFFINIRLKPTVVITVSVIPNRPVLVGGGHMDPMWGISRF